MAKKKTGESTGRKDGTQDPLPEQTYLFDNNTVSSPAKKTKAAGTPRKRTPKTPTPNDPAASASVASPKKPATRKMKVKKQHTLRLPYPSVFAIGYVALVLAWDALVSMNDTRTVNWAIFQWHPARLQTLLESLSVPHALVGWMSWSVLSGVDLFKVLFWLVIPVAFCLWHMDWDAFTRRRIQPKDWAYFLGFCILTVFAIVSVKFIPVLARQYPGLGNASLSYRLNFFLIQLFWVASWLPGWEFMHRYFLLRRVTADFPRFGWVLLPIAEGTYHLIKPWPETLAMVGLSIVITQYAMRRKNLFIPFLAHLVVELFLIVGMMVW